MPLRDILAIGTSAGGFDALRRLAREFPEDFPASVVVVIHLPEHFNSSLDAILTQEGRLPAVFAKDGMPMEYGRIYIAPPGSHLLAAGDTLRLGQGPRENNARPSIDPMFRSVALCRASRAVGAVLTGSLGDGAAGLHTLHESGGITVVQDPRDAAFSGMPEAVLMKFKPHHVVSLAAMPALFGELIAQPVGVDLAMVQGHVARGQKLIAQQQALIARLALVIGLGPNHRVSAQAVGMLEDLKEMQKLHEQHRDRLIRELELNHQPP